VCSGANRELALSLGAHRVIDYTEEDFYRTGDRYDVVFDAIGASSFTRSRAVLKDRGLYLTTVPTLGILLAMAASTFRSKKAAIAFTGLAAPTAMARDVAAIRDLIENGVLRPVIDGIYPMHQAGDAHRRVETGHKVGSVVLNISEEQAMDSKASPNQLSSTVRTLSPIPPGTQFLQLEEGRIAFDRTGSGPLVLLVPGMGDLRSSYRFLAPSLVAQGYTVVTCDLRGHGESSASFSSYGDSETADDIVALLEHLGEPATVVGNSMAAGAAVIAAAQHPEHITGLVLIGPFVRTPAGQGPAARLAFRILLARPWAAAVWRAYLPTLYAGKRPADFIEYRRAVVAAIRRPGYRNSFSLTTRTSHDAAEAALASVTGREGSRLPEAEERSGLDRHGATRHSRDDP
jgi:pimeloyl-ACP methyl ester carboxylesterase